MGRRKEGVRAEKLLQLDVLQLEFVKTLNQSSIVKVRTSSYREAHYSEIYYYLFLFSLITVPIFLLSLITKL